MDPKADLIGQIIFGLAEYYDKTLTDLQMEMYVEDLMDLDLQELKQAVRLYRNDPKNKFFPLPSALKGMLRPSDDSQAREAVSRIIYSLTHYGDPYGHSEDRTNRAKEYIGELGWLVVKRMGGWVHLSQAGEDDIGPIAQAQWRELANSIQTRDRLGMVDQPPMLPSSQGKHVELESKSTSNTLPQVESTPAPESATAMPNFSLFKPVTSRKREMTEKEIKERQEFLRGQLKQIASK